MADLSTVSRVQKANALKSKLKKVFRALDERRTGEVKEALFFSTLAEHSITLEKEDVATVKSRFARNGKLEYLNVLARIAPDLTDLTQQKWVFRVGDSAKSSVRDFLQTRSTTLSRPAGSRGGAGVAGLQYLNVTGVLPGEARSSSLVPQKDTAPAAGKKLNTSLQLDQIRSTSELPRIDERKSKLNQPQTTKGALSPADISKILEFPFAGKGKKMVKMYRKELSSEEKEKQLNQRFLYDHELNYDVVTNQYYDYNSPDQYKTKGEYKPKYMDDYINLALLPDDELNKHEEGATAKKNTKIAMYLAAKHKNNPQFFTQLQEAAKNQAVVRLVNRMMRSLLDPRQVISLKKLFLKNDKENKGVMSVSEFKRLFEHTITKPDDSILSDLLEVVKNEEGDVEFQRLLYLIDLYQFYPYIVKKDRNFSADLYQVLSGGLEPGKSEQLGKEDRGTERGADLNELLELLWVKIDERFPKIGNAFRYFDTNSNGLISESEFLVGMENLHVNLQRLEINRIFQHMDKDKDGYISYNEFCELLEEKRRGLDRFQSSPMSFTHSHFGIKKKSLGEEASSFMESMGRNPRLNSSDVLVSRKLHNYKQRRALPKQDLPSKRDASFTYGVATIRPDNISDVMQFNYQKDWLEKLKVIEKHQEAQRAAAIKAKGLKQVDTRASKLRNEALLLKLKDAEHSQASWEDRLQWKIPKYKNAKASEEIVAQVTANADFKRPWLSKKMALLKESVPNYEYQTQGGVNFRDDGRGGVGGGSHPKGEEYLLQLKKASLDAKSHNEQMQRAVQPVAGAETGLLDRGMLKELEQGAVRAVRESRRDKANMLNEYYYNKKALGRISTAQSGVR